MDKFSPDWMNSKAKHLLAKLAVLLVLVALLPGAGRGIGGESPALTEYQVKALFLLNFAKYVDWPAEAFAEDTTPITIGLLGENKFGDDLTRAVAGKSFGGRSIVIRQIVREEDWGKCHILFISASEKQHLAEILVKVKTMPILTVGESEQFIQRGGIINFMKKEGKVRLEIELLAARQARLQISSKLLGVADLVHGKQ
ncbi:MAG: hypothetical protein JWR69_4435 [Pedosphaera sp.]|jgi:hypothetical protein|nr:hypothetical protein [Pedosphaera sp.]